MVPVQVFVSAVETEAAFVPSVPQHEADGVAVRLEGIGHIISLVLLPKIIGMEPGSQIFVADSFPVQVQFINPQSCRINARLADRFCRQPEQFPHKRHPLHLASGFDPFPSPRFLFLRCLEVVDLGRRVLSASILRGHFPEVARARLQFDFGLIAQRIQIGLHRAVMDDFFKSLIQRDDDTGPLQFFPKRCVNCP
ncbi:hypothetical protein SDC9_87733 [bioreactor metagenome]|uniref:Uncharacterized protein n=1 Tax=bioreactor metagenome TaxID=1076179 RepID=A0A644ZR15_9ZZZZ